VPRRNFSSPSSSQGRLIATWKATPKGQGKGACSKTYDGPHQLQIHPQANGWWSLLVRRTDKGSVLLSGRKSFLSYLIGSSDNQQRHVGNGRL
jgi:hypothetical protein